MALIEGQSKHGVRFRYHKTRKHGATRDKYWSIRHYVNGKQIEEGLGWASEGVTEAKAIAQGVEFKKNKKHGLRPQSMREKREMLAEQERAEAEARQNDLNANRPFEDFFSHFIEDRKTEGRPHDEMIKAKSRYKKWIHPVIGHMPPQNIKILNLKAVVRKMEKAKKPAAPKTIISVIGLIGQVYNHHVIHHGYSGSNPVVRKAVLPPRIKKHVNHRERYLSVEEANRLLSALPEPIKTMALLSLQMGFRSGEIRGLRWSDISEDKISVRDTKSGQPRSLTMTKAVKEALMGRGKNNEHLFINPETYRPYANIPPLFKKTVDNLGLNDGIKDRRQKVVFHSLRHTCASWLVRAGIDIYTVKEVLGHSSITITERYIHEEAKFTEAAAVMNKISIGKVEEVAHG